MSDDLRTEDDIARLFADANPIPNHGRVDNRWRPATDIASIRNSDTGSDVMIGLEEPTEPDTGQGRDRRGWLLAAAVVALVVSTAVAVIDWDDRGSDTTATPITTPDTLPPTRLAVVEDFVDALSAYDVEAVSRTLTPGAVPAIVPGLYVSVDGTASLDDQLAWLEAFDWTSEIESCREEGDTGAYCTARQRNRLSDLVPLEMSSTMLFGFRDGLIDQVVVSTDLDEYGREAYRPFIQWVEDHHPDDVDRLWADVGSAPSCRSSRGTPPN
jgi:hypothetical protein